MINYPKIKPEFKIGDIVKIKNFDKIGIVIEGHSYNNNTSINNSIAMNKWNKWFYYKVLYQNEIRFFDESVLCLA